MKKLFFVFSIFISLQAFAQGNLQFNQVVKPVFNFVNGSPYLPSIGTITIPTGKVWKIEAVSYLNNNGSGWAAANGLADQIIVGDHIVYLNNSYQKTYLPLWLGAGTYDIMGYQAFVNESKRISISAIEFNVVP